MQNQIIVILNEQKIQVNSKEEAQRIADKNQLDLVEVAPNVFKVMDYKKYLYDRKKSQKQQKQQPSKDAQFNTGIADNDLKRKTDDICKWLSGGITVRVMVKLHGREAAHPELGTRITDYIIKTVTEKNLVSEAPKVKLPSADDTFHNITTTLKPARR